MNASKMSGFKKVVNWKIRKAFTSIPIQTRNAFLHLILRSDNDWLSMSEISLRYTKGMKTDVYSQKRGTNEIPKVGGLGLYS